MVDFIDIRVMLTHYYIGMLVMIMAQLIKHQVITLIQFTDEKFR